ncbi:MAG: VWA domain-containing protein [Nitrospirae bacterium]|nr:VWA domain-containing protein [Nitrospirota bacterium]
MQKRVVLTAIVAVSLVLVVSVVVASVSATNPKKAPFELNDVKVRDFAKVAAVVVSNETDVPLKKENVSITVDDQTIGDFSITSVNDESTSLILAIDVSRSMNGIPIANAKKYASYLLTPFTDGNYVTLLTFGNYIKIIENLSDDKSVLTSKIDSLTSLEKKTLLYSGISEGIKLAEKSKTTKTSMLVITDAKDEDSDIPIETLMKEIKKPHIPINVMIFGNSRHYFEPLDNITKLTKGTLLVNPGFEEIQTLSRTIFIPKRIKYLIDYNYSGPTGKHVCLIKLKHQGQDIELKKEFIIPAANVQSPESIPHAAVESKPKEETVVESSLKTSVQSNQWLLLLLIVVLLFVIVIILLLRKGGKSDDTSVTQAVKALQDELKKVTAGVAEIKRAELVITDNEGVESFIHGLLGEFVEGIQENIKNILRRLEMETKNAISNVRETKSQEYAALQQDIAAITNAVGTGAGAFEKISDGIRESLKDGLTDNAGKTHARVKETFLEIIAELKNTLTGDFASKLGTFTGAIATKEMMKDFEKRLEAVSLFITGIPPMRNTFEKHQLDIEGKLSHLETTISELKQNIQKAGHEITVQEKIDYEKIADTNKEMMKDFEKRLEAVSAFITGIPPMRNAFVQHQSDIEGMFLSLAEQLSELKQGSQKTDREAIDFEKIDYEKITDATKETLKDFEKRLEAVSAFISGIPPMRNAFVQHQSDIEAKLSTLSEQLSELKQGAQKTDYEAIDYEKIDYEKIADTNKETIKDFEKRLEAVSAFISGIPPMRNAFVQHQSDIEAKLSTLAEQLSELKQSTQKTDHEAIDYEKIDYEKITDATKETLKDFDKRLEAVSTFISGIPPMRNAFVQHQSDIEAKLSTLAEQLSELKQGAQKTEHEAIDYEKIDYEKITDATKETLKDFEKRLEAVSAFISGIPPMRNAFVQHQSDIEAKLSTLAEQLSELKQSTQKTDHEAIDYEKIDYEKITDATKETLKDFEKRLDDVSSFIAGIPPMRNAFVQHQSDIEEKLSGLSAEMAIFKDALVNVIRLLGSIQTQGK